jgi:hypothetical protein
MANPGRRATHSAATLLAQADRRLIVGKQLRKGRRRSQIIEFLKENHPTLVCDPTTISHDYKAMLAELRKETLRDFSALRDLASARYDDLLAAHWDKAIGDPDRGVEPSLKHSEFCQGVIRDQRQLWGLDIPVKTKVEVTDGELERQKVIGETLAEMKLLNVTPEAAAEFMKIYNAKIAADPNSEAIPAEYSEVEEE